MVIHDPTRNAFVTEVIDSGSIESLATRVALGAGGVVLLGVRAVQLLLDLPARRQRLSIDVLRRVPQIRANERLRALRVTYIDIDEDAEEGYFVFHDARRE